MPLLKNLIAQAPASLFPYQGSSVTNSYGGPRSFNNGYKEVGNALPNPLGVSDVNGIITKFLDALMILAVPVVIAMAMYGAWKIITSAGDPAKAKEGGNIILYAALGFGLLLISKGIVSIVQSLFQ
jgi:hypothetical protein